MKKKEPPYKVFNGKKYYLAYLTRSKMDAREHASMYRFNKFLARVVKVKASGEYHVYIA